MTLAPAAVLVLLVSSQARAPALYLDWRQIQGCPDREWIVTEIARLRGAVDMRAAKDGADVEARILPEFADGRWLIEVGTHSSAGDGFRSIHAETCFRAAEAASIVVALALAPFAPPPKPGAAAAPPVVEARAESPGAPAPFARLSVSALGTSHFGVLPNATLGGALALGLKLGSWKLEAQAHSPVTQRATLGPQGPSGVLSMPFSASLLGCRLFGGGLTELAACAELDAGWMHGQGEGLTHPLANDALWLAALAGLDLRVNVYGPLGLRLDGAVGAALVHPRFEVDPGGGRVPLYEVPLFNARATAGLEVRW